MTACASQYQLRHAPGRELLYIRDQNLNALRAVRRVHTHCIELQRLPTGGDVALLPSVRERLPAHRRGLRQQASTASYYVRVVRAALYQRFAIIAPRHAHRLSSLAFKFSCEDQSDVTVLNVAHIADRLIESMTAEHKLRGE